MDQTNSREEVPPRCSDEEKNGGTPGEEKNGGTPGEEKNGGTPGEENPGDTSAKFFLRENRSKPAPVKPQPTKNEIYRKEVRAKSIQESETRLFYDIRDSPKANSPRAVSFNGMSVMINNLLTSYVSLSKSNLPEMLEAVEREDLPSIRLLLKKDVMKLKDVLFKCVELNRARLLGELLLGVEDINVRQEENGQALLHVAALKGSLECARILVSRGAEINVWDSRQDRTPLHCAVVSSQRTTDMLQLLVNNNADINAGFTKDGGSVLNSAVREGNLEAVSFLLSNNVETRPKAFYESALHTAAENNLDRIAELLLNHNRMLVDALKGEDRQLTALHLAAEHGYLEVTQVLLEYNANVSLKDSNCQTALHAAARSRSQPVLKLILDRARSTDGDLVNRRDEDGRTALLVCTGSKGQGVLECMKTLLEYGTDIDIQDESGFTALHIAAIDRKPNRVNLLIEHSGDLSIQNKAGFSALYFINKKVPQCMKALESRMDSGIKLEGGTSELSSKIKLDFTKLTTNINSYQSQDIRFFKELSNSPHQTLLKHPLSEAFLYLKWNQVKYLYMMMIVFTHFWYSVVFSMYALLLYCSLCRPPEESHSPDERWQIFNSSISCNMRHRTSTVNVTIAAWIFLITFTFIYINKEMIKMFASVRSYLCQFESYLNLIIIISAIIILSINLFDEDREIEIGQWQYHAACIGSFCTWLYMMFLIGRVPRFGKYVEMFRTVSISVLNLFVAYIFLIIGFATAFMIAFPKNESFYIVPTAIIKLLVMMLGEIDDNDLYYEEKLIIVNGTIQKTQETKVFPVTAHFFIFLFIVLVAIILMNLLVGLAVSDIQGLSKSAKLHQLLQQVSLIDYMEKILFSPYFQYFPVFIQNFLRNKLQGLQVKCKTVYTLKPHDINDKTLPENLKKSIFDNCVRREYRETMNAQQREVKTMKKDVETILSILMGHGANLHSQYSNNTVGAFSNSLAVDDDPDSDLEVCVDRGGLRRRNVVGRIRRSRRGRASPNSDISSASTESEVATISDYVGFEDKEDKDDN